MGKDSAIAWCDATWQVVAGCSVASQGCEHCYSARLLATRLKHLPWADGLACMSAQGPRWSGKVITRPDQLSQPLHWKKPLAIFVADRGDLFHEAVPLEFIAEVFGVMAVCAQSFHGNGDGCDKLGKPMPMYPGDKKRVQMKMPRDGHGPHTFLICTKRARRMHDLLRTGRFQKLVGQFASRHAYNRTCIGALHQAVTGYSESTGAYVGPALWPLPNVWLGVTAENQAEADKRIPLLHATPAAHRWVSVEPCLENMGELYLEGIDQVIVGGESGPKARPFDLDWAGDIRDQCKSAGVPFFFKQAGSAPWHSLQGVNYRASGPLILHHRSGADPLEWPADLRVRDLAWRLP